MTSSKMALGTREQAALVRPATETDLQALTTTLADAFADDPAFSWCYPDAMRRHQIQRPWFGAVVAATLPHGGVYSSDDGAAGAVWIPHQADVDETLWARLGSISAEYEDRLLHVFGLMDEVHPHDPHHYLFLVGVQSHRQGCGWGSATLHPMLEVCDRDSMPAYLEATSARNRGLYERHGFEVVGEIKLPDGPSMWPMWREPRR